MGFMGDRSTLLETGRYLRSEPNEGTVAAVANEAAAAADTDTALTDAAFGDVLAETETVNETELEARHRVAADKGDPGAMSVLGALLLRRGDLDGAEPYLRGATAEGDRAAANNLGVLLHQRGYPEDAAGWWRVAAVAGSAPAAHALGRHYRERGDEPAAEYWLRQAAESGHALGAYALADLLEH
ncbi:sel1 repeat family protein, partial [Streptomyces bambusae]|nr:sel1 repeat family protein [Streptomyces bambusae]